MNRANQIQSIINARKPMAEKADKVDRNLDAMEQQLRAFKGFIKQFAEQLPNEDQTSLTSLNADIDKLLAKVSGSKSKMGSLVRRFERNHLSIGVIGRPKQGKSTLLQALSGLGKEVIPTGSDYCTGAASTLSNVESIPSGDATAEIEFHTEYSFLRDVIKPYWKQKSPDLDLGIAEPNSIQEFRSLVLPEAPGALCQELGVGGKLLDELKNIQKQLSQFSKYLGAESLTNVPKDQIHGFVAQTDLEGKVLYQWRAVKKATISCAFPVKDVGSIAFIDTPGLGQIAIGLEDYVNEALDGDIDFAMFMRRGVSGDETVDNDIRLYDLISKSLPEIPLKRWSAYIINRGAEDTGKLEILKRNIRDCKHLSFDAGIKEVDARKEDEPREMFNELLGFLAKELPALDEDLFKQRMAPIEQVKKECLDFAEHAKRALPKTITQGGSGQNQLKKLFKEAWSRVSENLKVISNEFRERRNTEDQTFLDAKKAIFDKLNEGCGVTLEEVSRARNLPEGIAKFHANTMQKLKVALSTAFDNFDITFTKNFNELRARALHQFTAPETGRLKPLIGDDPEKALDHFIAKLEESQELDLDQVAVIVANLKEFRDANLTYRGLMQPRIRQFLDVFDPDCEDAQPFAITPGESDETVHQKFEFAWNHASFRCSDVFSEMTTEPSMAYYAAIDRFVDSLFRDGGESEASDRWELFYGEYKELIWREEFSRIAINRELTSRWYSAVDALKNACGGTEN